MPEGHTYAWTESPLGINGYYLVSRGEKTPWRLKLRSASFNNIQVLREMLPGHLVADMVAILGSMFFVVGRHRQIAGLPKYRHMAHGGHVLTRHQITLAYFSRPAESAPGTQARGQAGR